MKARAQHRLIQSSLSIVALLVLSVRVGATTTDAAGEGTGESGGPMSGVAQAGGANLSTGTMSYSVPILVPPGRSGFTPQLALTYSSDGGEGPFGLGWSLPIGTVERSTKHGVPRCTGPNTNDFVVSVPNGTFELREKSPGLYVPETDEKSMEVELLNANEPDQKFWRMTERSGVVYVFGNGPTARLHTGADQFREYDPVEDNVPTCELTTVWALTEIRDPNGNTIEYTYTKDGGVLYPATIHYGGDPGDHPFSVTFGSTARSASTEKLSFRRGVKEDLKRVVSTITIGAPDAPQYRTYTLTYGVSESGSRVLLKSVAAPLLPPQTFDYVSDRFPHEHEEGPTVGSLLRTSNSEGSVRRTLMDVNGDGWLDRVEANGSNERWDVRYGTKLGLSAPRLWTFDSSTPVDDNLIEDYNTDGSTKRTAKDITGDGVADYIDARGTPWEVHRGRCTSVADPDVPWECEFEIDPVVYQNAPGNFVAKSGEVISIDFNADGIPDRLDAEKVNGVQILRVRFGIWDESAGSFGFEPDEYIYPWPVPSQENKVVAYDGDPMASDVTRQVFDLNGDGLPDLVDKHQSQLFVYWNEGRTLSSVGVLLNVQGADPDVTVVDSQRDTTRDFVDINGDGLPDRVRFSTSGNPWLVQFNLGKNVGPEVPWSGLSGALRHHDERGKTNLDLVDWNGDGLVDLVNTTQNQWQIWVATPSGKPNALKVAHNGVRGQVHVSYTPSTQFDNSAADDSVPHLATPMWVVTEIRRSDGTCAGAVGSALCVDGGREVVDTLDYEGGFFDADEREFRGFRRVTVSKADGSRVVTEFSQKKHTQGKKLLESRQTASGIVVHEEKFRWDTKQDGIRTQVYLAEHLLHRPGPPSQCLLTRQNEPDLLGRVSKACTLSCGSQTDLTPDTQLVRCDTPTIPDGQVTTNTTWHADIEVDHGYTPKPKVRDRPSSVTVVEQRAGGEATLSERKNLGYDTRGNLLSADLMIAAVQRLVIKTAVDEYGNVTEIREGTPGQVDDPTNNPGQKKTIYTFPETITVGGQQKPFYKLHPTNVRRCLTNACDGTGYLETKHEWDLAIGKITKEVDENAQATVRLYDALGRLTCEALPLDTCASPDDSGATRQFRYHYALADTGNPPTPPSSYEDRLTYIERLDREPNRPDGGFRKTRTYVDGLGRQRATVADRVVEGQLRTVALERLEFDSSGHLVARRVAHEIASTLIPDTTASRTSAGLAENSAAAAVTYSYELNGSSEVDPLGRPGKIAQPNGNLLLGTGEISTLSYSGARTTIVDSGGHKTEVDVNDRGHEVARRTFEGSAQPGAGSDSGLEMLYTRDGLGKVRESTVSGARLQTHTYDRMGRRRTTDDADSGLWTYNYNVRGQLTYRDDPIPGSHIEFCYDTLDRLVARHSVYGAVNAQGQDYLVGACSISSYPSGVTVETETFSYDGTGGGFGKGRLTSLVDFGGSESIEYDERGRIDRQSRTVASQTATMEFSFAAGGQVDQIRYPDGELVKHHYQADGELIRLQKVSGTSADYVSNAGYDVFGRLSWMTHVYPNATVRDELGYGNDLTNFRLASIGAVKTPASGPTVTLLGIAHAYNGFGGLQTTTDSVHATGPLSVNYSYEYDDAGRLDTVNWTGDGSGSVTCSSLATNDDCFDYDIHGNLTLKGGLELEYDPLKIHQVDRYGPETSPVLEMDHDLAGRRTERVAGAVTEVYTYNALGHLTRTSYGPNAQSATDYFDYQYDYRGQRVYKRETRQGSTQPILRTFSPYADDQGSGWRTKYYFFGDRLVAARQTTAAFTQTWPGSYGPPEIKLPAPLVYAGLGLVALLLIAPARRRGSVLAPARAAGLILVLLGGSWPTRAAACSQPPPQDSVTHYHLDRLGSILLVTGGADAAVFQQKRYDAYGNVRFRQNGDGTTASATERFRHEYTAWQSDVGTSLLYAGARYFDPAVGQFVTHDPVHQYASPYALGPGDPINFVDPTGAEGGGAGGGAGAGAAGGGAAGLLRGPKDFPGDPEVRGVAEEFSGVQGPTSGATAETGVVENEFDLSDAAELGISILVPYGSTAVALANGDVEGAAREAAIETAILLLGALTGGAVYLAAKAAKAAKVARAAERAARAVPEGIVYKRTNPKTGACYVGQCKSQGRYDARQREHDRALDASHEYEVLGRARPGTELDVLEESKIRDLGGLQREGGTLVNKRHQMSETRYRTNGGTVDDPSR